jgi:thiosulfate/3-mercaptopyruvate sulfurtransferase
VIDCSAESPVEHPNLTAKEAYLAGHFPGAQFLDTANLRDKASPYPNMIPQLGQFTAHMKQLGIGLEMPVVTYDTRDSKYAARAAWLLETFGHEDVFMLCDRTMDLSETGPVPQFSC